MEGLMNIATYAEYKNALDSELQKTAEGFVRIGYLLKLARDTDILEGSGYANVNEFARAEYNIDKTLVSRFININDRFAEDGNAPQLKEQYRGFGYAKLAIMLQFPDEVNEEISANYSKSEILAIKAEIDEEKKVSDIELAIEGKDTNTAELDEVGKVLWQLFKDAPDLFLRLYERMEQTGTDLSGMQEVLIPAGEKIYSIRLQGVGRILLSMKDTEPEVSLTNIRTGEKTRYPWSEIQSRIAVMIDIQETAQNLWRKLYGETLENTEVAPVQPEKKDSKVRVVKKKEKVELSKAEAVQLEPSVATSQQPEKTEKIEPENTEEIEVKEDEEIEQTAEEETEDGEAPAGVTGQKVDYMPEPEEIIDNNSESAEGSGASEADGEHQEEPQQGSDGDVEVITSDMTTLMKRGESASRNVVRFFDYAMRAAYDITAEDIEEIKERAEEVVAVLEQMINIKEAEE